MSVLDEDLQKVASDFGKEDGVIYKLGGFVSIEGIMHIRFISDKGIRTISVKEFNSKNEGQGDYEKNG